MIHYSIIFLLLGLFAIITGFLAFSRPESIYAKFVITIFKIDHRIKGILSMIIGFIFIIIGILYYFQ